jgi:anti-sigma28 factor (negative regulator of flagellin synthesis)
MSYTNGIGGQQTGNAITPSGAQPVVSVDTSGIAPDKHQALSANAVHDDEMAVSSTGGLVLQALEASDTRTAKVLSLQEAIAIGSHTVSSSDVADKMIQSLLK